MEFERAKVVVGGDSGVGKTALVHLICSEQTLPRPSYTVGCSVNIKVHLYKNDPTKHRPFFMELWDIGGSNAHAKIRPVFYQNVHGIILVYDCTNKKSQVNLRKWLDEILGEKSINSPDPFFKKLKVNNTIPMTSLLSTVQTHKSQSKSLNSLLSDDYGCATSNNESHPPVLVVGTKLDLLNPRLVRSMQKVISRFSQNYDNLPTYTPTSAHHLNSFLPKDLTNGHTNSDVHSQSVHIDLSQAGHNDTNTHCQTWNFAAVHGFSEIFLDCNSLASSAPNSVAAQVLGQFFDEVIRYKLTSLVVTEAINH